MTLIILGAGGYGRTIADVAEQIGKYQKIAFLDDKAEGNTIIGIIADFSNYINQDTEFYLAIGDNKKRLEWIEILANAGAQITTIIHPSAYVSPRAKVGVGSAILPGTIVNTDVIIGIGCIINLGAIIDHETVLEDGVHIAPGAVVKAMNRIKRCSKIESGTVIERGQMM
ncbi:PglD-related sugar-binding protein [Butyrivibrio sp. FC2001]|uniref:PglD-related sugar-binding protein n=1 Tax=Butyrivibrio sp. FC2001 TaxID=1280671 RepID=UPI0003FF3DAA|nr:hypothetical protein [Butyrivibrio sp. FC2001]